MSEALKKYQALLAEIKVEKKYLPGMGAAGKALLAECVLEAKKRLKTEKGDEGKPSLDRHKRGPQAKFSSLDKKIYKCAGLSVDDCAVAPHCFYQPKANRCVLRSGRDAVDTFNIPKRVALLEQVKGYTPPLKEPRYYPVHPLYDDRDGYLREEEYLSEMRQSKRQMWQKDQLAGSPKTAAQIAIQAQERNRRQQMQHDQMDEDGHQQLQHDQMDVDGHQQLQHDQMDVDGHQQLQHGQMDVGHQQLQHDQMDVGHQQLQPGQMAADQWGFNQQLQQHERRKVPIWEDEDVENAMQQQHQQQQQQQQQQKQQKQQQKQQQRQQKQQNERRKVAMWAASTDLD